MKQQQAMDKKKLRRKLANQGLSSQEVTDDMVKEEIIKQMNDRIIALLPKSKQISSSSKPQSTMCPQWRKMPYEHMNYAPWMSDEWTTQPSLSDELKMFSKYVSVYIQLNFNSPLIFVV